MKEATHILGLFAIGLAVCCVPFLFLSCEKPPKPDRELEDHAYPPEDMISFYSFPAGSWWHYKCLQDGTVDTLRVNESEDTRLKTDPIANGAYINRRCEYEHTNVNGQFQVGTFTKRSWPVPPLIDEQEEEHEFFHLYNSSNDDRYNGQIIFTFPLSQTNEDGELINQFYRTDTVIQGSNYSDVFIFPLAWRNSSFSNPIVEEWYVRDVGVVRYTLANGLEYELIEYQIAE